MRLPTGASLSTQAALNEAPDLARLSQIAASLYVA
jgi:hypothetical protein